MRAPPSQYIKTTDAGIDLAIGRAWDNTTARLRTFAELVAEARRGLQRAFAFERAKVKREVELIARRDPRALGHHYYTMVKLYGAAPPKPWSDAQLRALMGEVRRMGEGSMHVLRMLDPVSIAHKRAARSYRQVKPRWATLFARGAYTVPSRLGPRQLARRDAWVRKRRST